MITLYIGGKMKEHKITVYDYDKTPATKFEVFAWCVGGEEGIIAYFDLDGWLYEAHGDDGHWWLVNKFSMLWLSEIVKVLTSMRENF